MSDKPSTEKHDCDANLTPDCDICKSCHDHTAFCSTCGLSECCGSTAYLME